jgi:hypothetical protein
MSHIRYERKSVILRDCIQEITLQIQNPNADHIPSSSFVFHPSFGSIIATVADEVQ